jgi:hypothetical protein
MYFSDANGVSFGSSVNGASTSISASYNSTHSHGNPTLALTNLTGTTASASNGLTLSLSAAAKGIGGLGNTLTIPFTTGSVMLSAVNLTVNTSANGVSQYLQISAPAIGYLYFSNTNGHSWSSSVNGVSTSVYIL